MIDSLHGRLVHRRRVRVLTRHIGQLLGDAKRVLDIGSGDGRLGASLAAESDRVAVGADLLVRDSVAIPTVAFDGDHLPFPDHAFDAALLVDVLHHTRTPAVLLGEARRVAGKVVLKDHIRGGLLSAGLLRFMDWVGNAPHGVVLPYRYLSRAEWDDLFNELNLRPTQMRSRLDLYPQPLSLLFDGSLHFAAVLQ